MEQCALVARARRGPLALAAPFVSARESRPAPPALPSLSPTSSLPTSLRPLFYSDQHGREQQIMATTGMQSIKCTSSSSSLVGRREPAHLPLRGSPGGRRASSASSRQIERPRVDLLARLARLARCTSDAQHCAGKVLLLRNSTEMMRSSARPGCRRRRSGRQGSSPGLRASSLSFSNPTPARPLTAAFSIASRRAY